MARTPLRELAVEPEREQVARFLDLVAAAPDTTSSTSIRLPDTLREAAGLAVELGLADSTSQLAAAGLRDTLEAIAWQAALDAHYLEYPHARPSLAEVAAAAAAHDRNPLAARHDLIERAVTWCEANLPEPDADDVLLVAQGLLLAS